MKFITFTLVLSILLSCSLAAQEESNLKRSIGFTFTAFGNSDVINSSRRTLEGGPSYNGKNFYTFGVSYIHPIRYWLDVEAGMEFSGYTITVKPMSMPDMPYLPYDKKISLVNIPITARVNFLKYFFVNGGLLLDLETGNSSPIDNQTGIGTLLGVGARYTLNNGLGAFINGYSKFHSLIPLSAERDDYRWRLIEAGVRVGVTYSF